MGQRSDEREVCEGRREEAVSSSSKEEAREARAEGNGLTYLVHNVSIGTEGRQQSPDEWFGAPLRSKRRRRRGRAESELEVSFNFSIPPPCFLLFSTSSFACRTETPTHIISLWFSSSPATTFLVVLARPRATASKRSCLANEFPFEASSIQRAPSHSQRDGEP